jgi:hypothetical protein
MYFRFDGTGSWEAEAATGDYFRIVVCDDGTFDVNTSDCDLLPKYKMETFLDFMLCKDWCELQNILAKKESHENQEEKPAF